MNYEPNQNNKNDQNSGFEQQDNGYFTAAPSDYVAPMIDEQPPVGKGMAIASLVLGILGLLCNCCCFCLPLVFSILSVIFACVDRARAKCFRGLAITGLILGILGCIYGLITTVEVVTLFNDPALWEAYAELMENGDPSALEEWFAMYGYDINITV